MYLSTSDLTFLLINEGNIMDSSKKNPLVRGPISTVFAITMYDMQLKKETVIPVVSRLGKHDTTEDDVKQEVKNLNTNCNRDGRTAKEGTRKLAFSVKKLQ